MSDEPYFKTDKDEITFRDVELTITGLVHTKWPAGEWATRADDVIPLFDLFTQAMTACGLAERATEVYTQIRKLAEPLFVEVVKGHEEMRQDFVKKNGQW